jgi:predicted acylesterase/phospholipase RssA
MEQTGPSTGPVNRPAPVTLDQTLGQHPAIALSGGGTKGDFEVGAVRYLYDNGVHPKILCGTSVGSINALKLAEGEGAPTGVAGHVRGIAGL